MKALIPKCALSLVNCVGAVGKYGGATANVLVTSGNGRHRCEATNGHYLAIINGVSVTQDSGAILVPPKSLTDAKKMFGKFDDSIEVAKVGKLTADLIPTNSKTGLASGAIVKTEFNPRRVWDSKEDQPDALSWPNTDSILPRTAPIATCFIDPKHLIDLLRVAIAVTEGSEACGVTLSIYEGKGTPITLTTKNVQTGQFFDGMLMPLSPSK